MQIMNCDSKAIKRTRHPYHQLGMLEDTPRAHKLDNYDLYNPDANHISLHFLRIHAQILLYKLERGCATRISQVYVWEAKLDCRKTCGSQIIEYTYKFNFTTTLQGLQHP